MKKAIVLLLLFFSFATITAQKKTFLRIYDVAGKKIGKGYLIGTTDSTITLKSADEIKTFSSSLIGTIKTKRSVGHTALVVGGITAGVLTAFSLGVSSDDFFSETSKGELVALSLLSGGGGGGLIGALIGSLKKTQTFQINGKQDNWIPYKAMLDKMPLFKTTNAGQ